MELREQQVYPSQFAIRRTLIAALPVERLKASKPVRFRPSPLSSSGASRTKIAPSVESVSHGTRDAKLIDGKMRVKLSKPEEAKLSAAGEIAQLIEVCLPGVGKPVMDAIEKMLAACAGENVQP